MLENAGREIVENCLLLDGTFLAPLVSRLTILSLRSRKL